jgi:7,8-dihydropterin-6-yl-methyl-4-(beta-D-ribofuranosyl)aminobenzene 5'-phosphate synthase
MKFMALIENTKISDQFQAENGLSLLFSMDNKQFLFDAGQSGAFIENSKNLHVDLTKIDYVILSHGHFDHGGGLIPFLSINKTAKIYLNDHTDRDYIIKIFGFNKRIGLNPRLFSEFADRLIIVKETTHLTPNVILLPKIVRKFPIPKGDQLLYVRDGNKLTPDTFDHELLLVVKSSDGLVLVSGCSHNGILNMIATVKETFPNEPIQNVIGGLHLIGNPLFRTIAEKNSDVEHIAKELLNIVQGKIYTGHCTGLKGFDLLKRNMGDRIQHISTGLTFEL